MKILIIDDEFYIVEDIRLNTDWDKLGISIDLPAFTLLLKGGDGETQLIAGA